MKQLKIIAFILCGLLLATAAHATSRNLKVVASNAQAQKRVALVIGNAKYQGAPPLRNPVNDAHAMSNALNALGFEVIEVTDASQKEMNHAIAEFGQKLTADTAALFFYAGHGLQVKGKNYIVPVDAQISGEAAVRAETVDMDTVMDQLNAAPVSIVILDACRNNPFERSFRKIGGGGLAQMDAPKGSFIAYATAPGKTAADGEGKNGLFTQELLKQINAQGLSLEEVFKRVRANVLKATSDAQMPWDSSSMTGSFYFKPGKESQVASLEPVRVSKPSVSVPITNDAEGILWQAADSGGVEEDIRTYLRQYPNGKYVAQANARIQQIKDDTAQAAAQAKAQQEQEALQKEQDAWQAAGKMNTEASYQGFLRAYPSGRYAALATGRLDKLIADQEPEVWKKADSSNDKSLVESYLNKYPSGRYVAAASDKLKAIKEEEAKRIYVSQGGLTWMPISSRKTWAEANAYCSNNAINGQTGWRLPTENELKALYSSGAINGKEWMLSSTWSSTPEANGYWTVYLDDGLISAFPDSDKFTMFVTCVRQQQGKAAQPPSQQTETPKVNYVYQGGLTWMPTTFEKPWAKANVYCANTAINGQTGWRLPTIDELKALYDSGVMNGQGWTLHFTWSSTPDSAGDHYGVIMDGGIVHASYNTNDVYVTCVR
jgi:uncharacterized caspase-like protein